MGRISVIVRIHGSNTGPEFTRTVDSLLEQTRPPEEVLAVEDATVNGALFELVREYEADNSTFVVHRLEQPATRGGALKEGINWSDTDLVGILDCGDVAVPTRLARQRRYLLKHPDVDVVGGYAEEYAEDNHIPNSVRTVPTDPETVAEFARIRSPVNQPTVLLRKDAVLDVGNYRDLRRMEDYELWARMLFNEKTIVNLPTVLTKVQANPQLYARRGGIEYVRDELALQFRLYRLGFTSFPRLCLNVTTRTPVRILPNRIRRKLYRYFLRQETSDQYK